MQPLGFDVCVHCATGIAMKMGSFNKKLHEMVKFMFLLTHAGLISRHDRKSILPYYTTAGRSSGVELNRDKIINRQSDIIFLLSLFCIGLRLTMQYTMAYACLQGVSEFSTLRNSYWTHQNTQSQTYFSLYVLIIHHLCTLCNKNKALIINKLRYDEEKKTIIISIFSFNQEPF